MVEVVPVAMNSVVMWSGGKGGGMDGSMYSMFFWDNAHVDSEGYNVWSE